MTHNMKRLQAPTQADVNALVSLADAKAHLRVLHLKEDNLIAAQLAAAFDTLDGYGGQLGRALCEQSWRLTLDAIPCRPIRLPLVPFVSVEAIKYDDLAYAEYTIDSAIYRVREDEGFGVIELAQGQVWPSDVSEVRIDYTVGVDLTAADSNRAARLRAAILLMLGDLYDNRAAQVEGRILTDNPTVARLLAPLRVRSW